MKAQGSRLKAKRVLAISLTIGLYAFWGCQHTAQGRIVSLQSGCRANFEGIRAGLSLESGGGSVKAEGLRLKAEGISRTRNEQIRKFLSSSVDMTWATPREWFDYLNLEFAFTLDPCAVAETAKCKRFFTPKEDGLKQSWARERVFMNPPYGRDLPKWMEKAYRECLENHALVVCFVPARVDTQWWNRFAALGEIRFPIGRVKFEGAESHAPFPQAVVIFRPKLNGTGGLKTALQEVA